MGNTINLKDMDFDLSIPLVHRGRVLVGGELLLEVYDELPNYKTVEEFEIEGRSYEVTLRSCVLGAYLVKEI